MNDFDMGIAFIVRNKENLLRLCAGPTETFVVEQTIAALGAVPGKVDDTMVEADRVLVVEQLKREMEAWTGSEDIRAAIAAVNRLAALAAPKVSPGAVDDAMVKRALDAQPFIANNDATRVWQLMPSGNIDMEVMHAALTAAFNPEKSNEPLPPEAIRAIAVKAGIINADGSVTEKYA